MKSPTKLLPLVLLPLLASCASGSQGAGTKVLTAIPTPSGEIKAVPCSSLSVVRLSHSDTPATVDQAILNNAAIVAVCGAPKP